MLSTAEGHDKPVKYPEIFAASDVIVLNKIDLIDLVDFERERFYKSVRALNRTAPIFEVSCRAGTGIADVGRLARRPARIRFDFRFWILDLDFALTPKPTTPNPKSKI